MAAISGFLTLGVMIGWGAIARGILKPVPAALVAVVTGTAVAQILGLQIHYVQLPDRLTDAMHLVAFGNLAGLLRADILTEALALAFIASAETLLSAAAVDQMAKGRQKTNYDRELFSQGVGNMLSGFLGSLPMTGVIVRSAANVNAGAHTRLSGIFHGAWLLVLILAFPHLLQMVPTASLAAILVYTGVKLVNIKTLRHLNQYGWAVVAITVITTTIIVASSLLTGIIVGIVLSLINLLWAISKLDVRMERSDGRVDVHLAGSASFINLPVFADALDEIPKNIDVHLHIRGLNYVDHAALEALANWEKVRTASGDSVHVEWEELMSFYQTAHDRGIARPA
jgi:MFS superfamily sulfate permease-like transporter